MQYPLSTLTMFSRRLAATIWSHNRLGTQKKSKGHRNRGSSKLNPTDFHTKQNQSLSRVKDFRLIQRRSRTVHAASAFNVWAHYDQVFIEWFGYIRYLTPQWKTISFPPWNTGHASNQRSSPSTLEVHYRGYLDSRIQSVVQVLKFTHKSIECAAQSDPNQLKSTRLVIKFEPTSANKPASVRSDQRGFGATLSQPETPAKHSEVSGFSGNGKKVGKCSHTPEIHRLTSPGIYYKSNVAK